jgi:hypothetical protein
MRYSFTLLALALLACTAPLLVLGEDVLIEIGNITQHGILMLSGNEIGLVEGSTYALEGQDYAGGIDAWNIETGEKTNIVPSVDDHQRGLYGMCYENGYILVAGGGPISAQHSTEIALHVFEAATGSLLASCLPLGGGNSEGGNFMNDVATIGEFAYVTDSLNSKLMVVELEAAKLGECIVSSIDLPEAIFGGFFAAHGKFKYEQELLPKLFSMPWSVLSSWLCWAFYLVSI